jgi:nucleoside-diphosphate-sugar epimerase
MEKEIILLTGCSGYIGTLLIQKFEKNPRIGKIIGLDKETPHPKSLGCSKFHFIHKNTADAWEEEVKTFSPTIIIHTAWQIRELFGKEGRGTQQLWNLNGSHQVFDFAFMEKSVKKIIHFSSVSSYGAFAGNTTEYFFNEQDPLRPMGYSYADEKRLVENMLTDLYDKYEDHEAHLPQVYILRPASITGPYGKSRGKFGLQGILSGNATDSFLSRVISKTLMFMPVTPSWARQFIHEDDVTSIVEFLALGTFGGEYEIFNICPPGEIITGKEFASFVGKKPLFLDPGIIKVLFAFFWNFTLGTVPTAPGSWKTYSYPICVTGEKISKLYGYSYSYDVREAFLTKEGEGNSLF